MHKTMLTATLALLLLGAVPALSQEGQEGHGMEIPPEAMAAWQQSMTPGEAHAYLARYVGEWDFENTLWMAPGAPPQVSKGTSTKRMLFGGRYLEETLHGDMMGQPFEGRAVTAFDNTTLEFVGSWIDSMSTMMMVVHGTFEGGDGHTLTGNYTDPMTSQPTTARLVSRIISPDQHIFEYYTTSGKGEEFKSMAVVYKRKK